MLQVQVDMDATLLCLTDKEHKARCTMAVGNRSLGSAAWPSDPHWAARWHPLGTASQHSGSCTWLQGLGTCTHTLHLRLRNRSWSS